MIIVLRGGSGSSGSRGNSGNRGITTLVRTTSS